MTEVPQARRSELVQVLKIVLVSAMLTAALAVALGLPRSMSDVAIAVILLFGLTVGALACLLPSLVVRLR